jgi:pimeloyl-ACP methyl ester carboxylesterase
MSKSQTIRSAFLLSILLFFFPSAYADFPVSFNSGNCTDPAVDVGDDGLARVVWTSDESGYRQVYWGAYDRTGNQVHGPVRVNTSSSHSNRPRLALDAQNRSFIIWIENSTLHFSRLGGDGEQQVSDMVISTVAGTKKRADIDVTPEGIVHLVIENQYATLYYLYYAVRYADGSPVGYLRVSNRDTWGWEKYPTIAVGADGSAHMVWFDTNNFNTPGLYSARYTAMGQQISNGRLFDDRTVPSNIALARTSTGGPSILFQNSIGGVYRIREYVSSTDAPVVSPAPGPTYNPRIAGSVNKPTIAVWADVSTGTSRIRGAEWNLSGTQVESDRPISDSTGAASKPDIGSDGAGLYFIVWVDGRNGGNDIYLDTIEYGDLTEWPDNPGPSLTFRIEEDVPGEVLKVRLRGAAPAPAKSGEDDERSFFTTEVDVIGGFAQFTQIDLGFFTGLDIDRVDMLGADDLLLGHMGIEYTWLEDYFQSRSIDAYLFLHNGSGPVNTAEYPGWQYYQSGEHQASMLIPPQGDYDSIGGPQRLPVLFVHGINSYYKSWLDWDDTPEQVSPTIYDCWRFYYPYDQDLNDSAHLLGLAIKRVLGDEEAGLFGCEPYDFRKINIVAHSMGGLITRKHIQGSSGVSEYAENINRLLMLGTPNHGAHISYLFFHNRDFLISLGFWADLLNLSAAEAPANKMMSPGSSFLFDLNSQAPLGLGTGNLETDYLVVAGVDGNFCFESWANIPVLKCEIDKQSDGIVAVSSASLLNRGVPLALVDNDHNCMKFDSEAPKAIEYFLDGTMAQNYAETFVFCYVRQNDSPACTEFFDTDDKAGILELKIPQSYVDRIDDAEKTTHYRVQTWEIEEGQYVMDLLHNARIGFGDDNYGLKRVTPDQEYFFSRINRKFRIQKEIGFWGDEGTYSVRVHFPTQCGVGTTWHNVATDWNAFDFEYLNTTTAALAWDNESQIGRRPSGWRCLWNIFKDTTEYDYTVDSGIDTLVFSLSSEEPWDDFTGHEFVIEDPSGRLIDPLVAGSDPLINFSLSEHFGPAQYLIGSPEPGIWQIRHGSNIPSPQVVAFYYADFYADISVLNEIPEENDLLVCQVEVHGNESCLSTEIQVETFFTAPGGTESVSLGELEMVENPSGVFLGNIPDAPQGSYYFALSATCDEGAGVVLEREASVVVGVERAAGDLSGVPGQDESDNQGNLPPTRGLLGLSPNPFNAMTNIGFSVPRSARVKLEVFAPNGRKVVTLADQVFAAGAYETPWHGRDQSGRNLASGVYFLRLDIEGYVESRKMVILK